MTREEKLQLILGKNEYDVADLVTIVELLRAPGGCPWDREQTHKSLRRDFIEETYEVIEAIDKEDPVLLREELGDALLQIVMHARIEEEEGRADLRAIAADVCRKMIHRHPHVFGEVKADSVGEVLANWEQIKSDEKSRNTVTDKLNAIPRQLPALMRAAKVGKKASVLDFPDMAAVLEKLREETAEMQAALDAGDCTACAEEIGDLLFTVAQIARFAGVEPEEALTRATDKFVARFTAVEAAAAADGKNLGEMNDADKDIYWQKAKKDVNI
ncbi:MAG: nucleoside triphosphate pyrophosphohydrolase [Ruminococcaceae bacterium]|nr:nucleoside triphosphate pyrophosphohydrolase [Oscillospiraceae bacterium]